MPLSADETVHVFSQIVFPASPMPIVRHETVYYNVYYWSRVLLIHLIPCLALVVLNAGLIRTMRAAHRRHCERTSQLRSSRRLTVVTETHGSQYEMQLLVSAPDAPADAAKPPRQQDESVKVKSSGGESSTRATMTRINTVW